MFSTKKDALRVALVLLCLAGAGYVAQERLFPQKEEVQLVTAKAVREDLQETVLASGSMEAFKLVSVGAQVSGQIKALKVKLGDKVEKGQLVAEIDSLTQQNDLKKAQAELDDVRAQLGAKEATLNQSRAAFERQKTLLKHDATSTEALQTAEANFATAEAAVAALKAQIAQYEIALDTAKVNLGYTQITTPIAGTVVAIVAEEGQTVNAAQSAPTIIKVAQLDTMTIKAQISEADITRVKVGQGVDFTILGEPDHVYEATLRSIEPAPDSISSDSSSSSSSSSSSASSSSTSSAVYYNGLFDAPNPEGKLRISMTAEITIILNEQKNALAIPRMALGAKNRDGTYAVTVVDPASGQTMKRNVKVGLSTDVAVQILEGLKEGDEVVTGQATAASAAASASQQRHGPPPMGGF